MSTHSVADAKNRLSELIDRALGGEGIIVTRHGTPVVELRAIRPAPPPVSEADIGWLASRRIPACPGRETPSQTLAAQRDEDDG